MLKKTKFSTSKPNSLIHRFSGDSLDLKLSGEASIQLVDDSPKLASPEAASAARAKFKKYLQLADRPGSAKNGATLFATCLACHKVGDTGGIIGPDLPGAGAMSTDALLHDIILQDGSEIRGSLVEETKTQLSVQPIGTSVKIVSRGNISQHKITKSSLMPEGLIDHLSDEQIADLFTYMRTLK